MSEGENKTGDPVEQNELIERADEEAHRVVPTAISMAAGGAVLGSLILGPIGAGVGAGVGAVVGGLAGAAVGHRSKVES